MVKEGGGKNNCKLLITQQARVRPSDHLLTQKMRVWNAGEPITSQRMSQASSEKQNRVKNGRTDRGEGDRGVAGQEGEKELVEEGGGRRGGECQTAWAGAERQRRKEGGSVPCVHFLGHGA